MILENISRKMSTMAAFMASLLKVAVMSRKPSAASSPRERAIVVMGNGPSLRETIDNHSDWLHRHDLLAVNFAANTPDFFTLRPSLYVLADPHFFVGRDSDKNVESLWKMLADVSWPMALWVPHGSYDRAKTLLDGNRYVKVKKFNMTPLDGFTSLCHKLADAGLGMPRPRNVLIPSIMVAIREGYRRIYLAGADHTWTRTLSVDDENFVVSIQPHFYKDSESEHSRVRSAYAGLHLHNVLGSMAIAFESYWKIKEYADSRGVRILNATPGSMIDAFDRYTPDK